MLRLQKHHRKYLGFTNPLTGERQRFTVPVFGLADAPSMLHVMTQTAITIFRCLTQAAVVNNGPDMSELQDYLAEPVPFATQAKDWHKKGIFEYWQRMKTKFRHLVKMWRVYHSLWLAPKIYRIFRYEGGYGGLDIKARVGRTGTDARKIYSALLIGVAKN
ncbi:hypothetical protein NFJ02_45g113090 [Pycnococcus provasolii]